MRWLCLSCSCLPISTTILKKQTSTRIVLNHFFINILTLFVDPCSCNVSVILPEDDAVRVAAYLSM